MPRVLQLQCPLQYSLFVTCKLRWVAGRVGRDDRGEHEGLLAAVGSNMACKCCCCTKVVPPAAVLMHVCVLPQAAKTPADASRGKSCTCV